MSRRKLDLEMLKMVKSKADAQITLKATLHSPVRLKKNRYLSGWMMFRNQFCDFHLATQLFVNV